MRGVIARISLVIGTLGIVPTAAKIKAAPRRAALKYHPDKNKEEGASEIVWSFLLGVVATR